MLSAFKKLYALLNGREKRRAHLLLGLVVLMGIVDTAGVAAVMPFLAVVADPSVVEANRWLAWLKGLSGFEDMQAFVIFLGLLVLAFVLFSTCVKVAGQYALNRFTYMRQFSISNRLFGHYLRQPYEWFLGRHSAELTASTMLEVDRLVGSGMIPAMRILAQVVSLLLLVGFLMVVDPVVALSMITVFGCSYLLIYLIVRRALGHLGQERLDANLGRQRASQEAFGGIKELKLLSLEEVYASSFRGPAYRLARASSISQTVGDLPRHVLEGVAFGGLILLILTLLLRAQVSLSAILPMLGLYAVAGLKILPSIQGVYHSLALLRFIAPTIDRIHAEMTGLDGSVVAGATTSSGAEAMPIRLSKGITLRNVRYSYPGAEKPSINDLSMVVPAHAIVGIVGGTGSGKTTAVDLILGLLQLDSGEILIDDTPLGPALLKSWQNSIGYVPQQIFLTDDSIAANIAYGVPAEARDMAAVERAAQAASLHHFVSDLPSGYETWVGERGVRLSGGQRQRIGIARALYRDPEVLILDEATSALDNLTEREVMNAMTNIAGAKTIIMIAHRLSTVKACDTIFLLQSGHVAASGRYEDLLTTNKTFRSMAS